MATQNSLVTVITPVYNGASFLHDCILSVLGQTYGNIEYIVVDNCSQDDSLKIARELAAGDNRLRVVENNRHVGPIQNWNRSLRSASDESKYIKFVHADDWLFPECIAEMVAVAERNENIGIVSAYRLEEDRISLDRLPADAPLVQGENAFVMNGPQVARAVLAERASVLGSPTSTLLRTSAMGDLGSFYSTEYLHADKEASLRLLRDFDFGFVRQVLTFTRRHNESVTSLTNTLDTRRQENLLLLQQYAPTFMSEAEHVEVLHKELTGYYQFLAANVGTGKGRSFWESHSRNLTRAGSPFDRLRLARAFLRRWLNPGNAIKGLLNRSSERISGKDSDVHRFLDLTSRDQSSVRDQNVHVENSTNP
jgi:glycosyltransferase involved in cell wall biosynthesis